MIQYMIDIETLGSGPQSMVLSIAAVRFDEKSILDTIELYPDLQEQTHQGQKIDIQTLIWWQKNREILAEYLTKPRKSLNFCYHQLAYFLSEKEENTLIWAKSPRFDLQILENLWPKANPLWNHRNQGDVRIAEWKINSLRGYLFQSTKAHDSLADCIAQAKNVSIFLSI